MPFKRCYATDTYKEDSDRFVEEVGNSVFDQISSKSTSSKIRMYAFDISEGASIKAHIGEFITLINDMKNVDARVEDEDQALLLLISLRTSYK